MHGRGLGTDCFVRVCGVCARGRRYSLAKVGALDTPRPPTAGADVTSAAHVALARKLASAACILLKNEGGILPLSMSAKVAVIGEAGHTSF